MIYLRAKEPDLQILGVEITPESKSVSERPYLGSTAFIFGNEGGGLSEIQRNICDSFIYIPQFSLAVNGKGGMASINVACASAIVLYSFAEW